MRPGDLVTFNDPWDDPWDLNRCLGIVLRELTSDEKGGDPYPMYLVLFSNGMTIRCGHKYIKKVDSEGR